MKINLPNHIYKIKIWKNFLKQELVNEESIECNLININKWNFKWYEIQDINDSQNKILIIKKKTASSVITKYSRILILKNWDLESQNCEFEWIKHPNIHNPIDIDENYLENIRNSWENFIIKEENKDLHIEWLREPQIWALYSVLSNYTVSKNVFTVVMPTWTWKTETMLSILLKLKLKKLLVIVPSDALRDQLSNKFIKLWIFGKIWMINNLVKRPVVWILKSKPNDIWEFFSKANVIVSTINVISNLDEEQQKFIWSICSHLFIDEAHHTPANTRSQFKKNFWKSNIIQFTATPFRNDKKRLEWNIIYNYPLKKAQDEWYFKNIIFKSVFEPDEKQSDKKIRDMAVEQLKSDLRNGLDHILMARCKNIEEAEKIYSMYYNITELEEFHPILIHSKITQSKKIELLNKLKKNESKIVVCVDMLWEWYDLPNLKIAALHYAHKSLWITLQFIWRFARTWWNIWNATFVANIADKDFSDSLKEMYSEDSDWNKIISEQSWIAIQRQVEFQQFVSGFWELDIDISNIKTALSASFYRINNFEWDREKVESFIRKTFGANNFKYWINNEFKLVFVVEQEFLNPNFWGIKELQDVKHNLHIISYDEEQNLAYVYSDWRKSEIIKLFWNGYTPIVDDDVFKSFYWIDFLKLFIVWLKEWVPWNIKYRMHAGVDIKSQLTSWDQINKIKSNIFWFWFENWNSTSMWASRKGKIRAKLVWNLVEWKHWCEKIWKKLVDSHINWDNILELAMDTEHINQFPNKVPISIEWNEETYFNFDRISLKYTDEWYEWIENSWIKLDAFYDNFGEDCTNTLWLKFSVFKDDGKMIKIEWVLEWENESKMLVFRKIWGIDVLVRIWQKEMSIIDYLNDNPPTIRYADWSFLERTLLITPKYNEIWFNTDLIETVNWTAYGVDIKNESKWKGGVEVINSIQSKIIEDLKNSWNYDLIFNDDWSWECADIVTIDFDKDNVKLNIKLYHCKFSSWDKPWGRIWDLYEVCWQAQKSIIRRDLEKLMKHIKKRWEKEYRYENWDIDTIRTITRVLNTFRNVDMEIVIVQPWLSKSLMSDSQKRLLSVTEDYLKRTYNISMKVIASE